MISVLVTGSKGQLGTCIKAVEDKFPELKIIYTSSSILDITNIDDIDHFFANNDFDYCINCAAYTAVDKAESEEIIADKINHVGVENLAKVCKKYKATLFHISTDFVFDGNATEPYKEIDITNPLSVYGKTKLKGENTIEALLSNYFIIRTSWLYSEYGNNFLKTMLRLGKEREELSVVGDQMGSPTYAKDLAEVVLTFIMKKSTAYGLYHFSNQGVCSWYDFAKEIFNQSENKIKLNKITTKDYPTPAKRPHYSVLDTSKLKNALNITIPNWKVSLTKALSNLKE